MPYGQGRIQGGRLGERPPPGFSESEEKEHCHSPQQKKKRHRGTRKRKKYRFWSYDS